VLFAHLKRILRLDRLRQRGLNGAKDEFLLAATAQNLRKLRSSSRSRRPYSPHEAEGSASPRLQLPWAHIAIFRAPGTSTLSVDCSRLLCANSGHSPRALRAGKRILIVSPGRSPTTREMRHERSCSRLQTLSDGWATRCIKFFVFIYAARLSERSLRCTLTSRAGSDKPINDRHDIRWGSFGTRIDTPGPLFDSCRERGI
jgi:hypothetical protein